MHDGFIHTGELLLPASGVDPTLWACVACDQYTSQPEYWRQADALVREAPSALRLILPETELDRAATRVPDIHSAMRHYLAKGVLTPGVTDGFILTERTTESGVRVGLVVLVDLEGYDYHVGSHTPVRATEGTILERIPPRLAVRRGAALELSHVLMLVDDPARTVVEPVYAKREQLTKLYDFSLMQGGGHLRGYAVAQQADLDAVFAALQALKAALHGDLLYAVGDGNHSLATAKAYWEERKSAIAEAERATHPSRFAMVELENIHCDALVFEPIHRVLYGGDGKALIRDFEAYAAKAGWSLSPQENTQTFHVVDGEADTQVSVTGSPYPLAVGTLQVFLDDWLKAHPSAKLDYVHGDDTARSLAKAEGTVAFLLPALDKGALFPAVEKLGALPRKTFSMGEAHEKRYYMEARKLEK